MIHNKTPYVKLFDKRPNYVNMRAFGYLDMASNLEKTTDKFAPRGMCVSRLSPKKGINY